MTWIVVLVLTLANGQFIQENRTATSDAECKQIISAWVAEQKATRTDGSTFLTGCIAPVTK